MHKECLTLKQQKLKIVEFANSLDPDEAAPNELPHLDLHCLPTHLRILNVIYIQKPAFVVTSIRDHLS